MRVKGIELAWLDDVELFNDELLNEELANDELRLDDEVARLLDLEDCGELEELTIDDVVEDESLWSLPHPVKTITLKINGISKSFIG